MATAKTGSFYLTETVTLNAGDPAGTFVQGELDLSSYVNVPTGQAIAIDMVDFIVQDGSARAQYAAGFFIPGTNGSIDMQLTDLNPGTVLIRADDNSLIASGALNIDVTNNIVSNYVDIYPDNFGPSSLSEMFLCVNDTLYLVARNSNAIVGGENLYITARVRARVVKLGTKDWMAIAIQSTASDN